MEQLPVLRERRHSGHRNGRRTLPAQEHGGPESRPLTRLHATDPGGSAEPRRVALFDGDCEFCSRLKAFVERRDRARRLELVPLQSERARRLLKEAGASEILAREPAEWTLALIDARGPGAGRLHLRSGAALRIAAALGPAWRLCALLLAVPPPVRDAVYRWIARRRHRGLAACERPAADPAEV